MKPLFVTGIGTDVGKTVVSAVLVEKLKADYWKPIQSGDLDNSDTIKVRNLISNSQTVFHPEAYRLTQPFSPHKSAAIDGVEIDFDAIRLPATTNRLLVEGAGGLMVPLNAKHLIVDLIEKLDAEVILVVSNYLGSINHTLLSIEVLKGRNIDLKGIIISGETDTSSESYLSAYSGVKILGRIPILSDLDKISIREAGESLDFDWK
ncbi:dethiobiotin synthase [Desertivirga brevis]|uniref:dethiobiotin synthase n=1 Tax=Desertivirga brevis TaxID=2810310 RepID=UPI001A976DEE|nr:dethiobiotin synthase [Pedobacter sp. SYSU D00873]